MVRSCTYVSRLISLLCVLFSYTIIVYSSSLLGAQSVTLPFQITIKTSQTDWAQGLVPISAPFLLDKLTFTSDVQFQEQEFFYLVDLPIGQPVSADNIQRVVNHLIKKNKFHSIVLYGTAYNSGVHLHFDLQGFWTFNRLKIHSFMLGKDRYRHFYFLEPGAKFDPQKHEYSLQAIGHELMNEGYFDTTLETSFEYDESTKSVTVHLYITKGHSSTVQTIVVNVITHDEVITADKIEKVRSYILKYLTNHILGTHYNKNKLNQEMRYIKRYLVQQGFFQTDIALQETIKDGFLVDLVFTVDLYRKKEFIFQGNSFFSSDELLERVLLFGQSAWLIPSSIIQQEIEQFYLSKGFWDVKITTQEKEDATIYIIAEGKRARILELAFKGIHDTDQKMCANYFQPVLEHDFYDEELVEKAVDELINYYTKEGFLQVKLLKKEFIPLQDVAAYQLVISVYQGERTYLADITMPGYEHLLQKGPFLKFFQQKSPVPFTIKDVEEQQAWLQNYFQQEGYFGARLKPEFVSQDNGMKICWQIDTGKQKNSFGKTIVQGSCDFPFEYVVRELAYQEGEVWNKAKLKQSLIKFRDLEIFDNIYLTPADLTSQEIDKTVLLRLQKDEPYEVRVRTGFALQQVNKQLNNAGITYRAGGTFIAKNPFNWGDQLRIDGDADLSQHNFIVQYRRFWLFNTPIRTLLQGYSNLIQQPGLTGFKKNLYQIQQQGVMLGLTRKFDWISAGVNFGIDFSRTSIREESQRVSERFALDVAQAINFEPRLLNVLVPYVLIEPTFLIDYVDNKLNPTRGLFTLMTVRGMFPFGHEKFDTYFVRLLVEQSVYVPLMPFVIALRMRFGHIFNQNFRNIAPNERFYLGGANSLRSYETDRCPPLGVVVGDGNRAQFVPQGGQTMINLNFEARFPVFKEMGGVVFQDLGFLAGEGVSRIDTQNILAGTGFGARYNTPLGPLRFDIAWKWHKVDPLESGYAWFLSLGNAF